MSIINNQPKVANMLLRVIQKNRVAHAYLFSGKKGAGKKEMAVFFAQTLLCDSPTDKGTCEECTSCRRVSNHNHSDVYWVEPDGNSIKGEQIEALQKEASYCSSETGKKVYIIDRIETTTSKASNSLLKFIEEPQPSSYVILLTEQPHRVLPTIQSRCQQMTFNPPSTERMIRILSEHTDEALARLVAHLTANVEQGLGWLDEEWFSSMRDTVVELSEIVASGSANPIFFLQDTWLKVVSEKSHTDIGLEMLMLWYRDLLYTHLGLEGKIVFISHKDKISVQKARISQKRVASTLESILLAKKRLAANVSPQMVLEQLGYILKGEGVA